MIDLVGRADLLDTSAVHHGHAIGDFEGLVLVVRDEDAGHADFVVQLTQPAPELLAHLRIERTEWLVEQQHAGLDRECARQGDALALTAG